MSELTSKTYWEERAKEYKSNINSVLVDRRALGHEKIVKEYLSPYKNLSALDVACGYGRFSTCFDNYTGIDFCEEFINIAKDKFKDKKFECVDAHETNIDQYDIVFAVIAMSSLNMTPQEFNAYYKDYAKVAVMVFELDTFYIFPKL
ncbi:class I SAM-dependent methyltransferase [Candidatus Woesebacteria bacterium]|nr:class I SAM-dependent methyltransferase [Candidatus Woesebacteria bacterium]